MMWDMKAMKQQQYYFVDSRTSKQSVAEGIAREQGIPYIRRVVFSDHKVDLVSVRGEFHRQAQLA
jgi:hypothetical protein